ncbi:MAG: hypothetical protein LBD50_01330 [Rickettsiales bacterium]|jgi:tetratricopeptide (TPR) repeat protein|nr:hypothetical protein [Rickettsiales bacterium]
MSKIKNLFSILCPLVIVIVMGYFLSPFDYAKTNALRYEYQANKYGAFLAAQHALYINDFEKAVEFSAALQDKDIPIVGNTVILSGFLSGNVLENPGSFKEETGTASQLIHDAYLLRKDDWKSVYAKHKKDDSLIMAPLRIWSGVALGKSDESLKFISKLKTNDSWKSFVRGQIYAETNKPELAAKQFGKVSVDFINVNDYLYMIAFYKHNKMFDAAEKLKKEFTERPGGMYMLNVKISPDWSDYGGYRNALAFGLVQNVSHTQIMMYSDLSILMLRLAEISQKTEENNAVNYYIGQYFFNNGGDYEKYFNSIDPKSPFYSFALTRLAEKTDEIDKLEIAVQANPLFVPAVAKLVAKYVQKGDKNKALRVVDLALKNDNLTDQGKAFFLKSRANIYFMFDDMESAQSDIRDAADILPVDANILAMQSKIWSAQKRELETAYKYAIALVRKNPTDVEFWNVLGMAVRAKEGAASALELIERVGQVSESCSALFEQLGDLYLELGNTKLAKDAYLRAIDLSDDGLAIVPKLEKKLSKIIKDK